MRPKRSRKPKRPAFQTSLDGQPVDLIKSKLELFQILTSSSNKASVRRECLISTHLSWYQAFLERQFCLTSSTWNIVRLNETPGSKVVNLAGRYRFLSAVAAFLSDTEQPTLDDIANHLAENQIVRGSDDSRDELCKLVFSAICWLTMLYEPSVPSEASPLGIDESKTAEGKIIRTNVIRLHRLSGNVEDHSRLPVHQLLKHFGEALPTPASLEIDRGRNNPQPNLFSEYLVVSYLELRTLSKVARIKIEFVPILSLHLDFDEKERTLKIFGSPSFCRMVCSNVGDPQSFEEVNGCHQPYLQCLLNDYVRSIKVDQHDWDDCSDRFYLRNLCTEVLLSYRLIFEQTKGSWKPFSSHEYAETLNKSDDPLLRVLCASPALATDVFDEIEAPKPKDQYLAKKDFQFFGQRLLDLQRFVLDQNPNDLHSLWHDRRDILRFYTFWAVIYVGGASVLLSVAQVIIGILQLVK